MQLKKPSHLVVVLVLLVIGAGLTLWLSGEQLPVAQLSELQRIEQVEMTLPLPAPSTGDLDQMLERRLVRILVPFNKIYYFLDQSVRSRAGAVGIMQILPSTAAYEHVRIEDIASDPEQNIHAACKYMRYLLDKHLDDPQLDPTNRLLLGLAAYNAGPTNMQRMRNKAAAMGLDPNRWFANVEHAAAQLIGRETVQYVSNIYKYYLTYSRLEQLR